MMSSRTCLLLVTDYRTVLSEMMKILKPQCSEKPSTKEKTSGSNIHIILNEEFVSYQRMQLQVCVCV